MAETAAPTLAPHEQYSNVITALPTPPSTAPHRIEREALFDSLVQQSNKGNSASDGSPFKTFLTGLLWFGASAAIVVTLALVWSAARGLLTAF